jgi:hypothetical protein
MLPYAATIANSMENPWWSISTNSMQSIQIFTNHLGLAARFANAATVDGITLA